MLMLDFLKRIDEVVFEDQTFEAILTWEPLTFGSLMIGSGYLTHTKIMDEINRGEIAASINVFFFRLHPSKPLSKNAALIG